MVIEQQMNHRNFRILRQAILMNKQVSWEQKKPTSKFEFCTNQILICLQFLKEFHVVWKPIGYQRFSLTI